MQLKTSGPGTWPSGCAPAAGPARERSAAPESRHSDSIYSPYGCPFWGCFKGDLSANGEKVRPLILRRTRVNFIGSRTPKGGHQNSGRKIAAATLEVSQIHCHISGTPQLGPSSSLVTNHETRREREKERKRERYLPGLGLNRCPNRSQPWYKNKPTDTAQCSIV